MAKPLKREVVKTNDGSKTIYIPELEEHYHSIHGALNEANHVFIKHGLNAINKQNLAILEIGFGTGLNCMLTALQKGDKSIVYHAIEKYPVSPEMLTEVAYPKNTAEEQLLLEIHEAEWDKEVALKQGFRFKKIKDDITKYEFKQNYYDVIYFDAFAPRVQPNLWEESIFETMFNSLVNNGCLVTYCAKGQVKRNMKAVGFEVEPLPGPPGKREMTRAWKNGK